MELADPQGPSALEESERRFRLLVDSVLDYAIFLLDPTGHVDSWNAGAARLKGYAATDIIGQHYSVFYPSDAREEGLPQRLLASALEDGSVQHSGWRVRSDGIRFWANVVITALFDDGRHTGFAKVTRDMTDARLTEAAREQLVEDQRRTVQRLEDLDRWRRDVTGSVAHDLQTPVAAIEGFVALLRRGAVPEGEQDEVYAAVLSNTRALQGLIDNLRTFTSLSAGDVRLSREPLALQGLIDEVLRAMRSVLGSRPCTVDVPDVEVEADRLALERVLRNLLANVGRHTAEDTAVAIRATTGASGVRIEVRDDGNGIPEELLPRVFDRFESGARGGTGLGLSIVRQYVELHGGTIEVESRPGEGTTFAFTIPDRPGATSTT